MPSVQEVQRLRIDGVEYYIVDSIQDFRAEDSFIHRKNKLAQFEGNGEAKKHVGTYAGELGKRLSQFFEYSNWGTPHRDIRRRKKTYESARTAGALVQDHTCFFSKANLLKYLDDARTEYYKQEQVYHNDISTYYAERYERVKDLAQDHVYFSIYDASDDLNQRQNRGYIRSDDEKFFGDIDPSKRKQSQNRRYFITSVDENGKKYLDINIPNIELTSSGRDHLGAQIDQVGAILINKGNHSNSYLVPISDGLYNEIEEFAKKYNEWYSKNKEIDNLIYSYSDILSGLSIVSKYDPDFELMDDVATFEDKIESRLKELYKKNDECPDYAVVMKKIEKEVPMSLSRHILKP